MKTRIAFYSRVVSVERRYKRVWVSGLGDAAQFKDEDQGFFMLLEGSYEALHVGFEPPEFKVGDRVKVTMEKVNG